MSTRRCGGIGIHSRLKICPERLRVQVPSAAPASELPPHGTKTGKRKSVCRFLRLCSGAPPFKIEALRSFDFVFGEVNLLPKAFPLRGRRHPASPASRMTDEVETPSFRCCRIVGAIHESPARRGVNHSANLRRMRSAPASLPLGEGGRAKRGRMRVGEHCEKDCTPNRCNCSPILIHRLTAVPLPRRGRLCSTDILKQ